MLQIVQKSYNGKRKESKLKELIIIFYKCENYKFTNEFDKKIRQIRDEDECSRHLNVTRTLTLDSARVFLY